MSAKSPNEPSLAERAISVLQNNNHGTLATFSIKHPGFPFCSVVNYSISKTGEPLFLLSSMATHSRNLKSNPNASLMVATDGDLGSSRVTLIGTVEAIAEDKIESARESYLAANPDSAQWVNFGDFAFYRFNLKDCYIVAGFGVMGWVPPEELAQ